MKSLDIAQSSNAIVLEIDKTGTGTGDVVDIDNDGTGSALYIQRQCLLDNPNALTKWTPDFETHSYQGRKNLPCIQKKDILQKKLLP